MEYGAREKRPEALAMAENTLVQMYRGGIFDHIGGGFSRYSTDGQWLVPVAYGTTTLTATCSGKTATATVTVVRIPEEIHLNIKEIRLKPGEAVQLSAEFEPADADLYTALRWTTDTRGVATVDENGLVTAVGPGYTYIRATSTLSDYPEGYCDVTVENGE